MTDWISRGCVCEGFQGRYDYVVALLLSQERPTSQVPRCILRIARILMDRVNHAAAPGQSRCTHLMLSPCPKEFNAPDTSPETF